MAIPSARVLSRNIRTRYRSCSTLPWLAKEHSEVPVRSQPRHFYAFGPFVIDTARHLVTREDKPVALTPKTYDTLLVLVENHGSLLSKDELMKMLWPDSFVEEANLTQQISLVRKALGDGSGSGRFIVTVPGRGYRFAGEVTEWTEEASPPASRSTPPPSDRTEPAERAKPADRTRPVILTIAVGAAVLTLSGYLF